LEHIQASINQESVARHSLSEVFEQMLKTERTKLMNLITQKAAFARLDCENMQKALTEQIEKETSDRAGHADGVVSQLARLKSSMNERMSMCENGCQTVEQKYQAMQQEVREYDTRQRKLEEQLNAMLRSCVAEMQSIINDEKIARENADMEIEQHLEYLGDFHDKIRESYVQKGPRTVRLANAAPASNRDQK
jgi:alpha-amylase/alpha-mannosidase (GH57 family)